VIRISTEQARWEQAQEESVALKANCDIQLDSLQRLARRQEQLQGQLTILQQEVSEPDSGPSPELIRLD
jgi:hypothetical protein